MKSISRILLLAVGVLVAVLCLAVNGNTSFVIWKYDYTHKEWGARNYTQVSVQHWKDGKIIKEQFFYGN